MKEYDPSDFRFGMTYEPKPEDPVLVYEDGGFGFNPLNKKAVEGFFSNVKKAEALARDLGIMGGKAGKDVS